MNKLIVKMGVSLFRNNFPFIVESKEFFLIFFQIILPCRFYFLITYGVFKKRKYCNRMSEKKKFSPFDECSCFVYVKRQ